MPLSDLLYTFFIWPIRIIIEFLFVLFNRTFYDAGLAVVFLSLAVNTILLPIYAVADKWQQEERNLQKGMKKKLTDIKAVFKGDERQMIINAYYRQMGYSPLSALKSSIGLLLQIPFFIAAYQLLSHTPSLAGESFWVLKNLGNPDGFIHAGNRAINIMPFIMTAVNIASAFIYTKDLGRREKIQLFGISLVFLVLLYNSPSGLVLYWTCNNIFSLGKNIAASKLKHPGRMLQIVTSAFAIILIIGALSGIFDIDRYRFLFAGIGFALFLAPFAWKLLTRYAVTLKSPFTEWRLLYFSSIALLCLILGALIPGQVIAGSVSDFSAPWQFLLRTFIQSIAFTVLIPLLVWAFANRDVRKILAIGFGIIAFLALVCLFALSSSYGVMTNSFKIEDTQLIVKAFPFWVNLAAAAVSIIIPAVFVLIKKQKILASLYNATALAILVMAIINMAGINREIRELEKIRNSAPVANESVSVFPFTSKGTNTFVMFLDRALGIAMHTALEQMPELNAKLDGFTWYPNTLSFGHCTITGLPALMGGYDYTPEKIDLRKDELLKDKINESLTVLPKLFGEAGYRVSVSDPTMTNMQLISDISVFKGMKNVTAQNLDGRFSKRFMEEFPHEAEQLIDSFDFDILFRYGLFRVALPALRYGIHYKGIWWRDGASNAYGRGVTEYASLYYLSDFCAVDEGPDTLNIFTNETTHEPGAYDSSLLPVPGLIHYDEVEIAAFGSEDNASYMYTFMSAMKAVTRWIDSLKEMAVYDNSRIIIVSDHGNGFDTDLFEGSGMEAYNPLLLVKQPGARGSLSISHEFMTNADVPSLATADFKGAINPYLGTPINMASKSGTLTVAQAVSSQPRRHGPYQFSLARTRKLLEKDIFSALSWADWQGNK
ncbi:membrane protein insertase YidC [Leadbettera azotonutricia]|uniref:Inner membrane protein n=1 Tax=Leadbettera azotonutricia (strain ATCC BAA-888 / DSM 13862 / ZAS-9) TaxID=545695 RepID=F5YAU1_LEAAZ|nr:membrane protein insertase YidC [Leadbettera azotonutricia]AEF80078.1 inner membrane protein [Leadbettera azotonutricia ZAS-9]